MPQEWKDKIVVTMEELVPNWYTWPNLKSTLYRYRNMPTGPKKVQGGGNGRKMFIDYDTLPLHVQHGLGDPRQIKHVFEKYYRVDSEARRFFSQYQFSSGFYLPENHQDKYIINASVLKAVIGFRNTLENDRRIKGLNTRGIDEVLRGHVSTFQKTLQTKHNCQHSLPESLKRFKSCLNAFEKQGYISLISGKHGNDNSRKVTDSVMDLLESIFAKSAAKPSPTEVARQYQKFLNNDLVIVSNTTGEIYNPADYKALSEYTINKYLTSWRSKAATSIIRTGDRQKHIGSLPYASLKKPSWAGSLLSIDDRQPPFVMPDGKRIWLYVGVDVASGAYVCVVAGKTKEEMILNFYRQLVRNHAAWGLCLPDGLEAESSLNSSFVNTFLAEGAMFQNVRIEANNAQGKIIENFNRQMRYQVEKREENFNSRPFARNESNQAGTHKVEAMRYDDILQMCLQNYENWNNQPHDTAANISRWEFFLERQHPDLKPINYKAILPHLGYKVETSCNRGEIRLRNGLYLLGDNSEIALGDNLIGLMEKIEGRNVTVYWLDDLEGKTLKALVYTGNLLICEAIEKPRAQRAVLEKTDADKEAMAILAAYRNTVEAYGRRHMKAIERVTIIDNTPKPERKCMLPGLKQRLAPADAPVEILPEPDNEDYQYITQETYIKPLKDRF